jgi:hypothetical protein
LNVIGGGNKKISIGLTDGTGWEPFETLDWVLSGEPILDYEYCIVTWTPGNNSESYKIYAKVIDSAITSGDVTIIDPSIDPFSSLIGTNNFTGSINVSRFSTSVTDNYSQFFASDALSGYVFRPDINSTRNIPIVGSDTYSTSTDYTGTLNFNAQMDSFGPFSGDIGKVGIIERVVDIAFPVRNVRAIKIKISGFDTGSGQPVRANGLKIYTPFVSRDGIAQVPNASAQWNIDLRAIALS